MNDEQRIEKLKQLRSLSMASLVETMDKVKSEYDQLKAASSELAIELDMIRLTVLPEKMDEDDISTVTITGVGRVTLQGDIYFGIIDKEEAFKWLRKHGHGDIIQETINSSIGKAFAKELMRNGETVPDTCFKVTPFTRAQLTRIK
jgi:hypothetical protein